METRLAHRHNDNQGNGTQPLIKQPPQSPTMDLPSPHDLADSTQLHLPRELRDIVYAYLWDEDILPALHYPDLLQARNTQCEASEDDDGNTLCLCDTPTSIPQFAQAVFVGYGFAHEAVVWLYGNYLGFRLYSTSEVSPFYSRDVFHIGLTPSGFPLRRLTLEMQLGCPDCPTYHESLAYKLSLLLNLERRLGAELAIHFTTSENYHQRGDHRIYELAVLVKALRPTVRALTSRGIAVTLDYNAHDMGIIDVKHMLGSAKYERWESFINYEYAALMRQSHAGSPSERVIGRRLAQQRRHFRMGRLTAAARQLEQSRHDLNAFMHAYPHR